MLLTTYDRRGYRVAAQRVADSTLIPVAPSKLPLNVVNPERKRWDVVNLDTVRFTGPIRCASAARSAPGATARCPTW